MTKGAPTRVVVAGPRGRLGSVAVGALSTATSIELVATIDRGDDPRAVLAAAGADVLLDATLADASRDLALAALEVGARPVIGVSGLGDEDVAAIGAAVSSHGGAALIVPNFSLGAVLAMRAAEWFAAWMPCTSIEERHHPAKRDTPSGTALATARRIAQARGDEPPPITSQRRAGVLAEQRTTFTTATQTLVVEHVVHDRAAFAPGILIAVAGVGRLSGLVVGLDSLLDPP